MNISYFDIKNTAFAVCGTKLMSITLNVSDFFIQAAMTVVLAIVGVTAQHYWKRHVLEREDKKVKNNDKGDR